MAAPSESELVSAIEAAARRAISELFRSYPEHFYYCTLITGGEGQAPILSAWSEEALERRLAVEKNPLEARPALKWSYADSPFFAFGEGYFSEVEELFSKRPQMTPKMSGAQWMDEYALRLRAMEEAMARLDRRGLFGSGDKRLGIVVNVEVMPPDYGNTERAFRLNPREALSAWLVEIAEDS